MGKVFKKAAAFLLMSVLMISMIPGMVFAEGTGDVRNVIYVQVPEDWQNPCVWAWNEDGTNAFETWPGEAMDRDVANDGWYYIWVPSYANHIIVNANDSGIQTDEVILEEGSDAWITIADDCSTTVTYDAQTTGETPEYVEKFAVHVQADENWDGVVLTAKSDDGEKSIESVEMVKGNEEWYSIKIPVWADKITISTVDSAMTTEEISVDPAELWIMVAGDTGYELSYVDPEKAGVQNVTVCVKVPKEWEGACLWAWSAPDGTNVYNTWPGESFEEGGDGWLYKEIPGWVNSVIVNANEGSVQTTDISIDTGKDIWIVVNGAEDFEVSYEEPENKMEEMAVVAESAVDETTENAEEVSTESNAIVPIIVIIVAVVIIGIVIAVLAKKKK